MMTKKAALKFKSHLDNGDWPTLPPEVAHVLQMTPKEILKSNEHAHRFGYGNGYIHQTRRLIQMGLLDEQCNLTNFGESYLYNLKLRLAQLTFDTMNDWKYDDKDRMVWWACIKCGISWQWPSQIIPDKPILCGNCIEKELAGA
jgi:hypothetical protein